MLDHGIAGAIGLIPRREYAFCYLFRFAGSRLSWLLHGRLKQDLCFCPMVLYFFFSRRYWRISISLDLVSLGRSSFLHLSSLQ